MKAKSAAILLAIVCIVLGGALWYRHTVAVETEEKQLADIFQLSNEWKQTSVKLEDQRTLNLNLDRDLANRAEELKTFSNNLATTSANLAKTRADAKAALEAAEVAMKARDDKIKELEGERDDLTKRMTDLNGSIIKLENQIAETERKLRTSEGDREYLMTELKRLQAEKAELERKFQDLALLREQVRKLQNELSIARRLEWIRRGLYGDIGKGAEILQRGFAVKAAPSTNALAGKEGQYNLDVELSRDGTVKVNTNAPASPKQASPLLSPKLHNEGGTAESNPSGAHPSNGPMSTARGLLADSFGRVMRDLRVSLTDRCNFRCLYCLPETEEAANFYRSKFDAIRNPRPQPFRIPEWKPRSEILSFEEIERLVQIFVSLGIRKVRLTGGEPLLRQGVEELVSRVARIPGIEDLAMTSNGFLFLRKGRALREAGLRRISFSLDSLERDNFKRMTGRDGLNEVLASIALAQELGLAPVKVNAVVIRGLNDHEIEPLAEFARARDLSFRFIEFMPLDSSRSWQKDLVVPGREILHRLQARFELKPVQSPNASETARRWAFADGRGEIGIIAPVSEPFCGHCNRIRVTADGKIRTCLFSIHEHDLKSTMRGGASDEEIADQLRGIVLQKEDRHHIGEPEFVQPARTMSCIGG